MGLESIPLESIFRQNHFQKYPPKNPPLHSIIINTDVLLCRVREANHNVYSRVFTDRDLALIRVEFR